MLMWSETLGPAVSVNNTLDASWRAHQRVQLDEMLDSALNHPCIFAWAWFNEGPSWDARACPAYGENAARAHQRDGTRVRALRIDPENDLRTRIIRKQSSRA